MRRPLRFEIPALRWSEAAQTRYFLGLLKREVGAEEHRLFDLWCLAGRARRMQHRREARRILKLVRLAWEAGCLGDQVLADLRFTQACCHQQGEFTRVAELSQAVERVKQRRKARSPRGHGDRAAVSDEELEAHRAAYMAKNNGSDWGWQTSASIELGLSASAIRERMKKIRR